MSAKTIQQPAQPDPLVDVREVVVKPYYYQPEWDERQVWRWDESLGKYCFRHQASSASSAKAAMLKAIAKRGSNLRIVEGVKQVREAEFKQAGEPEAIVRMRTRSAPLTEKDEAELRHLLESYGA